MSPMYEYKVVPAPVRADKVKGLKSTADRFAHTLAEQINAQASGGWQFERTETMTCEVRKGLGGLKTITHTVMIFSRLLGATRPDAGAAVAAAQGLGDTSASAGSALEHAHPEQAGHAQADLSQTLHTPQDYLEYRDADALSEAQIAEANDAFDQQPAPAPQPPAARQEPLFRAAPLTRPGGTRPDPVLRPPSHRSDDR
tara:strand:- start:12754 stop:13350 length:597 start_codon:yes stop_codon:yes gene_type:complete